MVRRGTDGSGTGSRPRSGGDGGVRRARGVRADAACAWNAAGAGARERGRWRGSRGNAPGPCPRGTAPRPRPRTGDGGLRRARGRRRIPPATTGCRSGYAQGRGRSWRRPASGGAGKEAECAVRAGDRGIAGVRRDRAGSRRTSRRAVRTPADAWPSQRTAGWPRARGSWGARRALIAADRGGPGARGIVPEGVDRCARLDGRAVRAKDRERCRCRGGNSTRSILLPPGPSRSGVGHFRCLQGGTFSLPIDRPCARGASCRSRPTGTLASVGGPCARRIVGSRWSARRRRPGCAVRAEDRGPCDGPSLPRRRVRRARGGSRSKASTGAPVSMGGPCARGIVQARSRPRRVGEAGRAARRGDRTGADRREHRTLRAGRAQRGGRGGVRPGGLRAGDRGGSRSSGSDLGSRTGGPCARGIVQAPRPGARETP